MYRDLRQNDAVIMTAGGFAMGNIGNTTTDQLEQQYRFKLLNCLASDHPILDAMKQQGRRQTVLCRIIPRAGHAQREKCRCLFSFQVFIVSIK